MVKASRYIILILVILIGAGMAWWWANSPEAEAARIRDRQAKIVDLKPMVRLCTVDLYEEVPIRANIATRHLFGRTTLTGSISYDLDSVGQQWRGDTLYVSLPRETVEIYESTDPYAYQVYDTWNDKFLGSGKFTAHEENVIKAKVVDNYRRRLYERGDVARARKEARTKLAQMLSTVTQKPAVVE